MKKTPAETEMYVRPVPVGIYVVQWEEVSQFDNTPTVTWDKIHSSSENGMERNPFNFKYLNT